MHVRNEPVLFEAAETLGLLPQYNIAYPDIGPFHLPFPSRSHHFPPLSIQATRRPLLSLIWTTESCFPLRIFSVSILISYTSLLKVEIAFIPKNAPFITSFVTDSCSSTQQWKFLTQMTKNHVPGKNLPPSSL